MPCHISEFILRMELVWDPFPICLCYTLWWISVNLPVVFSVRSCGCSGASSCCRGSHCFWRTGLISFGRSVCRVALAVEFFRVFGGLTLYISFLFLPWRSDR